jgi:hypothetical protein
MRRLLLLLLAFALAACAGAPAAQAPVATVAPTSTPLPTPTPTAIPTPSATPAVQPSPTALALSPSAVSAELAGAMGRTAALGSYHAEIDLTGDLVDGRSGTLLAMEGDFAGEEYEITAGGLLTGLLGADPVAGQRAIRADGASYLHGPLALLGAVDDAWYRLPAQQSGLATPPIDLLETLGLLANFDFAGYTSAPFVQRGELKCIPYQGDRDATVGLLRALAQSGLPGIATASEIERAESTMLVCDDGLLHELQLEVAGESSGNPPAPFGYSLDVTLSDLGEPITISAPPNAKNVLSVPGAPRP